MLNENISKAKMLEFVNASKVTLFKVPNMLYFSNSSINENLDSVIYKIKNFFSDCSLAIRSSAADEDTQQNSIAGGYSSVLNVPLKNEEKIIDAFNKVLSSYEKKRPLFDDDEVIVQEMVTNTSMSGVLFTYDLNTGAPYYVINYDDRSGITDTVTSGSGEFANRTLYVHRNSIDKLHSERFRKLLEAVQELEEVLDNKFLDIEFAMSENLTTYLLQVRKITTQTNWNQKVSKSVDLILSGVQSFVKERFKRKIGIYGETTALGQMPDWNPVEMIGRVPRALAASLYQVLITDHSWRYARDHMGYAVPTGEPLMVMIAGQPFIDTRLSFHSFIPKDIPPVIAEKLVNHWVNELKNKPEFHDKIEFDIAITCYSFDFEEKIEKLIGDVLSDEEKLIFKKVHQKHTFKLIKGIKQGSIDESLEQIEILNEKQKTSSSLYALVDDCIRFGTIPFSILARHGFIAKTLLISLKQLNVLTQNEINQLMGSINTIASELVEDINSLQIEKLSVKDFLNKYGHLRPGTYDIMSLRYDQMKSLFSGVKKYNLKQDLVQFDLNVTQKKRINKLLKDHDFYDFKVEDLLDYIYKATQGREYSKFIFTRSVSNIIEIIRKFSEDNGLSRDEISHVPINVILNIQKNSSEKSIEEILRNYSIKESEKHNVNLAIRLPQIISDNAGAYIVPFQVSHANYITNKKITAPVVVLFTNIEDVNMSEKIVIIEGADPGFDWIFSQEIAGLITKYGGANSHMAIRCAEFGLPAAIGCGEQKFEQLLKSNYVQLDCASGLIQPIN